jgi:[ribosomal protein S18]-alanine N-acetyltransferase
MGIESATSTARDGRVPASPAPGDPQPCGGRTGLEFRGLGPDLEEFLGAFFESLRDDEGSRYFHPHPMTREEARRLCAYRGRDLYYAATQGDRVLGYGMLRGWDEGYTTPSLGIAVAAAARGTGLARSFMAFLHAAARLRGARDVRLKVYEANTPARRLYAGLGYRYEPLPGGELLGRLELGR